MVLTTIRSRAGLGLPVSAKHPRENNDYAFEDAVFEQNERHSHGPKPIDQIALASVSLGRAPGYAR